MVINRELVDQWCERLILALALGLLVLLPLAFGGFAQPATGAALDAFLMEPFVLAEWLVTALLILWAIRFWVNPKYRLLWPPVCWAVLAFTSYAVIRYFTADIEYLARQELVRVIVYAFVFFVVLNNLHRQESTQMLALSLIFLAMALSFYAVYQFAANSDRVWHLFKPYPHRGSGTYICPNHLAGFLEMLLPLGLAYTLSGRVKPVTRILVGYASFSVLAGIAATVSRGAWVAVAISLGCFFVVLLLQRQHRLPAIALLLVLAAGATLVLPRSFFIQQRIRRIVTNDGQLDDDARFKLWQPALRMWKTSPLIGVGPAHFDYRFRAFRPESLQEKPSYAHNDYLNTLADYGIIGVLLNASVWVFLGWGVIACWRAVRGPASDLGQKRGSNKFAFVLGASAGLLAILVHSFVDFNFHVPANALLAVALMALLSSHLRFASERYWFGSQAWVRLSVCVVLVTGAVFLAVQATHRSEESYWLAKASGTLEFSPAKVTLLKKAFHAEPGNPETANAIAESLRRESQEGGQYYDNLPGVDYRQLAAEALTWFQRGMKLNPWDARNFCGYGWCLDWLGRTNDSAAYFARAEELDPNSYFTLNDIGLHNVEMGDYAAARPWFERSFRLQREDNVVAQTYLLLVKNRLLEAATNYIRSRIDFSPPPAKSGPDSASNEKP